MDGTYRVAALGAASSRPGPGDRHATPPDRGGAPVFWLRPVFVPLHQLLECLPIALAFGLWGMFFLEGWTSEVLGLRGADASHARILGLLGPTLALGLGASIYCWSRRTYAGAAYHFHSDVLEVVESNRRATLPLARVISVEIERSRAQTRLRLGTLFLFLSTAPGEEPALTCLRLPDVPHPEHARARILELAEQAKRGQLAAAA